MSHPLFREDYSGQTSDFKVDRENSVVHNVKILGWKSRNKRNYIPEGVRESAYEGALVNIDHSAEAAKAPPMGLPVDRALPSRSVRSRFARLTGVTKKADGLYAESMTCNPAHPYTAEFLWWAEHAPDAVVLSPMHAGPRRREKDGSCTVLGIVYVDSVDVVSRGGTNATLFESDNSIMDPKTLAGEYLLSLFPETSLEDIKTKLTKALESKPAEFTGDVNAALEALRDSSDPRVKIVVESYDARTLADVMAEKAKRADAACKTAKLPEAAIFVESLVEKNETEWPKLIEAYKKAFATTTAPKSGPINTALTASEFVKGFRRGN